MPSTPSYTPSESDKTMYSSTEEEGRHPLRDPRRTLSILPTIPHNRQFDASTVLSRQNHRTLERTNSIHFTGPRRVDAASRIPVDFRTLSIEVTETTRRAAVTKGKKDAAADFAALDWHTLSVDETCGRLGVAPEIGLDKDMAARRLSKYGKNVITPASKNLPKRIFFYFFGGFGSLLIGASIICFIAWKPLGEPAPQASNLALAVILLVVVSLQAAFNAWQDYTTGRVMSSISGMLPSDVLVCRDGNTFQLPASELVSGDIVKITLGTKVPADIRLISCSSDLRFDRSILTGESKPVAGTSDNTDPNFLESRNIALQGTLCLSGSGIGCCVSLGDHTVFGRIAKQASGDRPVKTSLEVEITRFVWIIASLAAAVAAFIAILWGAWLRVDHPGFINVPALLINLVSVAVAFIPEGLPVCVTLSLTVIANSMKKKNILCKSLSTVESLGCVSVICSDKTGTLTQNKMAVANVAIGTSTLNITDARHSSSEKYPTIALGSLAAVAGLCNDAAFESESTELPAEQRKVNGDATDTGLLRFAESVLSVAAERSNWDEIAKLAFNSKNKFAIKLFSLKPSSAAATSPLSSNVQSVGDRLLLVKGAPDILLRRCSSYLDSEGQTAPLDEKALETITSIQHNLASKGERVLLLAKKVVKPYSLEVEITHDENSLSALNVDLTIVGLVSLVDPLREDTAETVRICRRAGIRFMMVTGDMSITAASIASSAGIFTNPPSHIKHVADLPRDLPLDQIAPYNPDKSEDERMTSIVLSGSELLTMSESQWQQVLSFDEVVFARTSPQQKLQIVKAYQAQGCTVSATGDGLNDVAALKQADVGVAVAGGSEVAMEAADLILLDQFSAIVQGIESGRLCFENLKKSILYLLPAGSFSELMPVLVNVLFGLPQALSNIQMILICVLTDLGPALSMCFEKPEADLLLRKPRDRKKERLADFRLLAHAYFFLGVLESLTSMVGAFYFGFHRSGIPFSTLWLKYGNYGLEASVLAERTAHAQSIYFFNLVIMQWFNLLATRTRRLSLFQQPPIGNRSTSNVWIFPAMLASLCFAVFFSYIPPIQRVFGTKGVAVEYYFLPMAYGVGILLIDEGRKFWNRGHPRSLLARMAW